MRKILTICSVLITVTLLNSCGDEKIETGDGFLDVDGGKIWYRVSGTNGKIPLLLLHGGTAYPSYYLNPLKALGSDRLVITFDQLGCGRSDRLTDVTNVTLDSFVEQVEALLEHLGVDEVYVYGHSFGTTLSVEHYLKYPKRVRGLILNSPYLNTRMLNADQDSLIATLPDSIQVPLKLQMSNIVEDTARLRKARAFFYSSFYDRKPVRAADLDSSDAGWGVNVRTHMLGTHPFYIQGLMKDYDITPQLQNIKVPTVYITGEFDVTTPAASRHFQSLTPGSTLVIISNSGHSTMHDNINEQLAAMSAFLAEVEK
jgi:proline iminopeptidase